MTIENPPKNRSDQMSTFSNLYKQQCIKNIFICFFILYIPVLYCQKTMQNNYSEMRIQKNGFTSTDKLFGGPPNENAVIFGKGIVSMPDRTEYGIAITKDYSEIFFTASGENLMLMNKLSDSSWTAPKVANLRQNNSDEFEAFYSYDEKKVFFSYMVGEYDSRINYVEKTPTGFSTAFNLDSPINNYSVFWSTLTQTNTIYFTNFSLGKIFRSKLTDGKYKDLEDVGLPKGVFHPFVALNEEFVIFDLNGDIYISFLLTNGKCGTPVKFNNKINTADWESCASLSPDGKYLFFARYNELNEKSDIYWAKIDNTINDIRKLLDITNTDRRPPFEFELKQNFPNPFNPLTIIKFNISQSGMVNIKVYDILGKEVCTLLNEQKQPGSYSVEFKTDKINSKQLSSGVYFYRIKTGNFSETKKMLLLK